MKTKMTKRNKNKNKKKRITKMKIKIKYHKLNQNFLNLFKT